MLFLIISLIFSSLNGYIEKDDKIIVGKYDTIKGDLAVIGKDLEILGCVEKDVAIIGGDLKISGSVKGDVAVVGGDCIVLNGGIISGDLAIVGGKIKMEKGGRVLGEKAVLNLGPLTFPLKLLKFIGEGVFTGEGEEKEEIIEKDTLKVEKPEVKEEEVIEKKQGIFPEGLKKILFPLISLTVFFFFIFMVNIIFPDTVKNMEHEFVLHPWQIIGTGFLIQIVYIPVILILIISILGIPLAITIILATPLFLIYGSAPLLNLFGKKILKRLKIEYKREYAPLFASFLYFFTLILIIGIFSYFDIDNFFYYFLKFFFFSIFFLSFYVIFIMASGIIFFSKLGIKKSE